MPVYKFTSKAEQDLESIVDYTLARWGHVQAGEYISELETRAQILADNADLGVMRDSIREGLLSFPFHSHIIYYVKQSHGITIIRVLHQRMDPVKHMI